MPPFKAKGGFPPGRKSLGGTPAGDTELLVERLSYADLPRPFKNPYGFTSKLPYRTASTTTTSVKKSTKQILVLERERVGGGDGFLPANLTRARARGEIIEPGGKKKRPVGAIPGQNRRGFNLKGRKGNGLGGVSGVSTPNTGFGSERTTPGEEDEEDEREEGVGEEDEVVLPLGKEVFTYHTPTAPPSLLPTKKYCDITGLHASYTDPRTKLRYKGLDVWHVVRGLGPGSDQAYLALRGAQTHLK